MGLVVHLHMALEEEETMVPVAHQVVTLEVTDHQGVTTVLEEVLVVTALPEMAMVPLETQVVVDVDAVEADRLVETMGEVHLRAVDTETLAALGVEVEDVVAPLVEITEAVEIQTEETMEVAHLAEITAPQADQVVVDEDVVDLALLVVLMEEDHLEVDIVLQDAVVEGAEGAVLQEETMVEEGLLVVVMEEDLRVLVMVHLVDRDVVVVGVGVVAPLVEATVGVLQEMGTALLAAAVVDVAVPLEVVMDMEDHLEVVDLPVVATAHQVALVVGVMAVGTVVLRVEIMGEDHREVVMGLEDQVVGEVGVGALQEAVMEAQIKDLLVVVVMVSAIRIF